MTETAQKSDVETLAVAAVAAIGTRERRKIWEAVNALLAALKEEEARAPSIGRRGKPVSPEQIEKAERSLARAKAALDYETARKERAEANYNSVAGTYPHMEPQALQRLKTARAAFDMAKIRYANAEARLNRLRAALEPREAA